MPIVISAARETVSRGLKLLVYGRPKVGKTVFAASAQAVAELAPVLVIDADHGAASLGPAGYGNVIVATITRAKDLTGLFNYLASGQKDPTKLGLPASTEPFRTVVLDSMTEVHRLCMASARDVETLLPGELIKSATRRDFGISLDMVLMIVRSFTQLAGQGMNVIYTAREKTLTEEASGAIYQVAPALPGQAGEELGAYADIVGRLMHKEMIVREERKTVRVMMLSEMSAKSMSGTRYGSAIPQLIAAPTMGKLMHCIREGTKDEAV